MLKESDLAFERYLQLQPDSVADPYPFYEPMRAEGSIRWSEGIGGWVITGYEETEAPLRQAHVSSNWPAVGAHIAVCFRAGASARRARAPLVDVGQLRAHDLTRMRSLVNKAFTPRAAEAMRARIQTLTVMLPTADIARRITADLGTQVMARRAGMCTTTRSSLWNSARSRRCNARLHARPTPAGTGPCDLYERVVPNTDALLARSFNISIGVSDLHLCVASPCAMAKPRCASVPPGCWQVPAMNPSPRWPRAGTPATPHRRSAGRRRWLRSPEACVYLGGNP